VFASKYKLSVYEAETLLDLLLMDVVFHGAIQEPSTTPLDGEDLEMIFYSSVRTDLPARKGDNFK